MVKIFNYIFFWENLFVLHFHTFSLMFVPKRPTDNKSVLAQVTAWCWIGEMPLPESLMAQWKNSSDITGGQSLFLINHMLTHWLILGDFDKVSDAIFNFIFKSIMC